MKIYIEVNTADSTEVQAAVDFLTTFLAPTPAAKEKPAVVEAEPKVAKTNVPTMADGRDALRALAARVDRDAAIAVLNKYAETIEQVSADDLPALIADCKATGQ